METSGKSRINLAGARVSTLAPNGKTGNWLIDPQDFTIASAGGDISGAALSSNLEANSITILSSDGGVTGNGDIFVNDSVSWSSNNSLTLSAERNVGINMSGSIRNIFGSGNLTVTAGSDVAIDGGFSMGAGKITLDAQIGSITMGSTGWISTEGGDIELRAGTTLTNSSGTNSIDSKGGNIAVNLQGSGVSSLLGSLNAGGTSTYGRITIDAPQSGHAVTWNTLDGSSEVKVTASGDLVASSYCESPCQISSKGKIGRAHV